MKMGDLHGLPEKRGHFYFSILLSGFGFKDEKA